jgi:Amt family ammonium transporter
MMRQPKLLRLRLCILLVLGVFLIYNGSRNANNSLGTQVAQAQTTTNAAPPPAEGSAATTPAETAAPAAANKYAGDPGGGTTGNINDLATAGSLVDDDTKAKIKASGPGVQFLADNIGQNRVAINMVWLLMAGFLVMFMQAGFALVETGFCRAKNASHTMMMNFACYFLGIAGFWLVGFALMYGNAGPISNMGGTPPIATGDAVVKLGHLGSIFATKGFFLSGNNYDVGVYAMFLFQMVFMDTAVTIVTGSMAERWKFSAFIVYCFFMSCILYPLFGHWAWGGGWLSQLGNTFGLGCGYVDFAGSGVVHSVGGLCALAGAIVLGPRIGKYNKDGSANAIPGHHIPMAILGCLILGFGWFGFNPGSTFGASGFGNLRIGIVATTTMLAGAAGAITSMIYMYWTAKKPDPTMIVNGFLAGLVAITAPSGFVSGSVGMLIGGIAGVLVCLAVPFFDKLKIDDPVGAISVHGVNGMFGVLCVGLFADGTYGAGWNLTKDAAGADKPLMGLIPAILHGNAAAGMSQLMAQLVGMVTLLVWAFGFSYVFFRVQKAIMGIRVSAEDEIAGLDIPETGVLAYPSFMSEPDYTSRPAPAPVGSTAPAPIAAPSPAQAGT